MVYSRPMLRQWLDAVRRNHALEHATVAVMLSRLDGSARLAGRALPSGFILYGSIPTEVVQRSAEEGLARLQAGERQLAVSPLCGTNIAVAAILTGIFSVLTMGDRRRLERLPSVFLASAFAMLLAQPLGRMTQKYITTRPDLDGVTLQGVEPSFGGRVHKVRTSPLS